MQNAELQGEGKLLCFFSVSGKRKKQRVWEEWAVLASFGDTRDLQPQQPFQLSRVIGLFC